MAASLWAGWPAVLLRLAYLGQGWLWAWHHQKRPTKQSNLIHRVFGRSLMSQPHITDGWAMASRSRLWNQDPQAPSGNGNPAQVQVPAALRSPLANGWIV